MPRILDDFPHEEAVTRLKHAVGLTKSFTDEQIAALARIIVAEEYQADEVMMDEDEAASDIYVIISGTASVEMKLPAKDVANAQILTVRENGIVGEFAFLDGSRRSASVRILAPATVFRLPSDALRNLCETNTALGYRLMQNLGALVTHRIRSINFGLRSSLQ
jgi:CRP-like cAMP-binding protein